MAPEAPTASPGTSTFEGSVSVTLSTVSEGAVIRYTTNGTAPTKTTGTLYSEPIVLTETTTIKAIAVEHGFVSSVTTKTFTLHPSTPTATPAETAFETSVDITLASATTDAAIYYTTDGATPTAGSTVYSGVITVSATTTIKAIAIKGELSSGILTKTYTLHPTTPTSSPSELMFESSVEVSLSTATEGADIYYRTDGEAPTGIYGSTKYSTPITLMDTTTIKAIAAKDELISGVLEVTYTKNS